MPPKAELVADKKYVGITWKEYITDRLGNRTDLQFHRPSLDQSACSLSDYCYYDAAPIVKSNFILVVVTLLPKWVWSNLIFAGGLKLLLNEEAMISNPVAGRLT